MALEKRCYPLKVSYLSGSARVTVRVLRRNSGLKGNVDENVFYRVKRHYIYYTWKCTYIIVRNERCLNIHLDKRVIVFKYFSYINGFYPTINAYIMSKDNCV